MTTREYFKINNPCELCETEFEVGDLVYCAIDPLYLTDSVFDCGRFSKDVGIVVEVSFFRESLNESTHSFIICELAIHWGDSGTISYHLDKYIKKFEL